MGKKKGIPLGRKPSSVASASVELYHGKKGKKTNILGERPRKKPRKTNILGERM